MQNRHSDYDVVIIGPDTSPPELQDDRLAYAALAGTGVAVDEFYGRLSLKASLPSIVVREGRLLYAG